MMTRLLSEQNIRRRRADHGSPARTRHERAIDTQARPRRGARALRRIGAMIRLGMLGVAVAALGVGLVVVARDGAAASALTSTVVSDELEHAAMDFDLPMSVLQTPPGEVSFERTEESEYVVAEGETLSEIADRFDLSYEMLASYNRLADPNTLVPGQRILVPSADTISDLSS